MGLNQSEKILLVTALLLSSCIMLYNLFYIPSLPNANIIKEELVFQDIDEETSDTQNSDAININSATLEELKKIPEVGESMAKRIIDYREQNGGFASKKEIMNVSGIGQKKFDSMKDFITIN